MNLLYQVANWKIILPLFVLFLFFGLYLFPKYQSIMNEASGKELKILDLRTSYSVEEVHTLFNALGENGRVAYETVTSKVDTIYPIIYGSLLVLLIVAKARNLNNQKWAYLIILPILVVLIDFIENYNTLTLLNSYPSLDPDLIQINSLITSIKWFFVALSIGALLVVNMLTLKAKNK